MQEASGVYISLSFRTFCCVLREDQAWGKTLYSHSASLHPGV